jgi:AraC-like DNA-binding protein
LNLNQRCCNEVQQMSNMDRIVFSTDTLPERKRFSAYREELAKWSCGLDLSTPDQFAFRAEFELRRIGSVETMTHTVSTIETVRTPRLVRDGDDALLVMLLLHGRGHQSQFNERNVLNAGDTVICDCGYPGALNLVDSSKLLTLKIPRNKLSAKLPRLSRFAGTRLDSDSVAQRLLSSYLSGTLDLDLRGSVPAAQLHQDHLIDLVALALGAGGEMRAVAEQRGAQPIRRAAVLREIEVSLTDPTFDASIAAARLGITVRYVHHLLEATGRTFSEHQLDRRLARVEQILRDPRHAPRRIADIAFEIGFRDLSYFNRVFRRKYGATPTDIRHAAIYRRLGGGDAKDS